MRFHLPEDYSDFEANGFRADKMNRDQTQRLVREVIKCSEGGMVLGLDAQWGAGKTAFVKMLEADLKAEMPFIYFDAYRSDYHHSPVVSIAGEIYEKAKELKLPGDKAMEKMAQAVSKLPDLSIKGSINAFLRVAGVLLAKQCGYEQFADVANDVAGELFADIQEKSKGLTTKNIHIENYNADKKSFEDVYLSLKKLAEDMVNQINQSKNKNAKNLVFVIDELDRCRPDYAIALLETIKHLFLVPNIVFILVMNRQQLAASIQGVHGVNFNANLYLEKFIHLNIELSAMGNQDSVANIEAFIETLFHKLDIGFNNSDITLLSHISENANIPMRQLVKVIITIGILKNMRNNFYNDSDVKGLVFYVCLLNVCDKDRLKELENICRENRNPLDPRWLHQSFGADLFINNEYMQSVGKLFADGITAVAHQENVLNKYRNNSRKILTIRELILSVISCVSSLSVMG